MFRMILGATVLTLLASLIGCGSTDGTNGGGGGNVVSVTIQSDRVSPQNVTISPGNKVMWVNSSSTPKQVISGTLDETGSPLVEHTITIGNTGFTPAALEANFGDSIVFNNLTPNTFHLQILNTGGQVVSSLSILAGHLSEPIQFDKAGKYFYQNDNNSLFKGSLILFGQPNPSGQFQSPVLFNGGTFTAQFDVQEFIDYFVLDVNNPNRSFISGSIRVQ